MEIYDPAIPLLGIDPKHVKTPTRNDFLSNNPQLSSNDPQLASHGSPPKCPAADEWIKM